MTVPGRELPKGKENSKALQRWLPVLLAAACIALLALTHFIQKTNPTVPSAYNTYTLQALQWRKGEIALDRDYPHLELAIYQGRYYVSFPPVPAVPIYLLTFIFGAKVPDALLIQLYALASCLIVYAILKTVFASSVQAAVMAFLILFSSSFLPLLQNGAVWYQAQVLAFLLTVGAILCMQKGRPTASLLFFALSVGCRPFNVLYGPLLLWYGLAVQKTGKTGGYPKSAILKMLPGLTLGLCVAGIYAAYNHVRFGSIFEFNHNYLPEFSTQGGQQFSFRHILNNAGTFVWGLPFSIVQKGFEFKHFGFSMFLANPILLCLVLWWVRDVIKKRSTLLLTAIFMTFILHALGLLMHRTGGGFQYGARYFVDCIPYAVLYLRVKKEAVVQNPPLPVSKSCCLDYMLLIGGLIMSIFGAYFIHL